MEESVEVDMGVVAEMRGWWEIWMDRWSERWRMKAMEPRIWVRRTRARGYSLIETTCANEISLFLHCTGLAASRAEAQRLLKQNGVEKRSEWWDNGRWEKCRVGEKLPEGQLIWLRRGKSYFGLACVIIPVQGQTLRYWKQQVEGRE